LNNAISILHISDFHARVKDEVYLEQRVSALFNDLSQLGHSIDIIVFTGDLAYYGKKEDYDLADRLLIQPLRRRVRNGHKQVPFVIVPGNHDVDRDDIKLANETKLRKELSDSPGAFAAISDSVNLSRLRQYYDYLAVQKLSTEPYSASILNLQGVNLGIASLNTAWRCSGDEDKEYLFVTEEQVHTVNKVVEPADIKIALLHHPFDWLHTSEGKGAIDDIKNHFDIVLTGHLHEQDSHSDITPAAECLLLAAPAFCDGKSSASGYNIYTIFFERKRVMAKYRKFIRNRQEFDKDTDFAQNGEKEYTLPVNDLVRHSQALLCQRLSKVANTLDAKLKQSLCIYQGETDPIYVTPPLQVVTWNEGRKESTYLKSEFTAVANSHALIYGAPETGKTDLLCAIGSAINSNSSQHREGHLAIYHNSTDKATSQLEKQIRKVLDETLEAQAGSIRLSRLTILLDHSNGALPDILKLIPEITERNPNWTFVVATTDQVKYNGYAASPEGANWSYYQLAYWGPSRIREFITKFFGDDSVDVDAAFTFVSNSLREADLPAIPLVVILYLNVFRVTGNRFSSLSFLDLLQKYEGMRFAADNNHSEVSTYNKERLLAALATECFRQKTDILLMTEVRGIIDSYFRTKGLPYNAETLIEELAATGLVEVTPEFFTFRYYVFYDYYLARALQVGLIEFDSVSPSLHDTLRVANSLALYGGLIRENLGLATRLLDHIEKHFSPSELWRLSDLDLHIKGRFMPEVSEADTDQVTTHALDSRVDYSKSDDKFHQDREQALVRRREAVSRRNPADMDVGVLAESLKAFYNIFRNLENIALEDKVRLLNRILDFHVKFNIEFIDYMMSKKVEKNVSTFFGYIVTLASQAFLSANIGNQTLKEAIDDAIGSCDNDFKELLLLFLYADLRLPAYELKLEKFCKRTTSRSAVEMIFFKLFNIMVQYEKKRHPTALISAFRTAVQRRNELGDVYIEPKTMTRVVDKIVDNVSKKNIVNFVEQQNN